jgi:DnaK suppressor protein
MRLCGGARRHEVKTPAKKATKAAAKAPAKVAAPAKKVSPKSPVKAKAAPAKTKAAAPQAKPKAKPVAQPKAAARKPVVAAKVPAKKSAPSKQGGVKKPVPSAARTKAAVPVAKKAAPAPKVPGKTAAAVKTKPAAKAAPAAVPAAATVAPVAAPVLPVAADLPVRSSRPSARLAQITVPSMPQAVASTAAKASFLPSMLTTVLPVPAVPAKKDPKLANNWKSKPAEKLTDAEVLAMPDSEYMNDVQMAFFRIKLVQLKQGILANAGETTEHLREDTVVVPDPADRATIEEEHALELRTRDRERKLLKKIEQSIARIDAGDYGYCDETGEPIGVGRLLARPTATLSLEAQQRRELKQKMFGD